MTDLCRGGGGGLENSIAMIFFATTFIFYFYFFISIIKKQIHLAFLFDIFSDINNILKNDFVMR